MAFTSQPKKNKKKKEQSERKPTKQTPQPQPQPANGNPLTHRRCHPTTALKPSNPARQMIADKRDATRIDRETFRQFRSTGVPKNHEHLGRTAIRCYVEAANETTGGAKLELLSFDK